MKTQSAVLQTNPTFKWVIQNAPPPKREGIFYSYAYAFRNAYGYTGENMGSQIRFDLQDFVKDLAVNYAVGVQLGVKSNGERGIRVFSLK